MTVKFQDYYQTLGVDRSASAEEIRKAYRTLARKFHPDVNKGADAEERFKAINEAYEVLKDPEKRKRYDSLGSNWRSGQEFRPPPGFESFSFNFGGPAGGGFRATRQGNGSANGAGGFSEFFETLFGGLGGGQFSREGFGAFRSGGVESEGGWDDFRGFEADPGAFASDIESEIEVPLEKIIAGGMMKVRVQVPGLGQRTYDIRVPKGIAEGRRIRLSGQGQGGGDLFLRVKYGRDPRFAIEGRNLVTDLRVAPWEAALGTKVPVETLDGRIQITIPAGSSSGKRLRVRGHGLPDIGGERGDLFVRLMIQVPGTLEKEEKELYEKLSKVSTFKPRG